MVSKIGVEKGAARYPYDIEYNVVCDYDATNEGKNWTVQVVSDSVSSSINDISTNSTRPKLLVSVSSEYGCGFGESMALTLFRKYFYISIPLLFILGLYFGLVGHIVFRFTFFLTGLILGYNFYYYYYFPLTFITNNDDIT